MSKAAALLFATIVVFPSTALAEVFMWTGLVKGIYTFDSASGANIDHFTLDGFTPANTNFTCPTQDGLVAVAFRDDAQGRRHYASVLAVHLAGKPIRVRVDNTRKNASGQCHVWLIERIEGQQ